MGKKLNLLVISSGSAGLLKKAAEIRLHKVTVISPNEFSIYMSNSTKGFDSIYYNEKRILKGEYDAVITRVGASRDFASKVIHHFQYNLGVWCLQSGSSINICADKVISAQIMSEKGLRVPRQIYAVDPKDFKFIIDKLGGLPVILKEINGSKGKGIILLESPRQTNMTLESFYGSDKKIILQQFLDNGGKDERHIVVGKQVVCSMQRSAPKDDIRANVSLAGTGTKITATKEVADMCVAAVAAIPSLNFAGVDIMKNKDPKTNEEIPYFIEINSNPGEKIIEITGHNYFEDILNFAQDNFETGNPSDTQMIREIYETRAIINNLIDSPGLRDAMSSQLPGQVKII